MHRFYRGLAVMALAMIVGSGVSMARTVSPSASGASRVDAHAGEIRVARHTRRTRRHRRRQSRRAGYGKSAAHAKPAPLPDAASLPTSCADNPDPLGVARVVTIDTSEGPQFGGVQYKDHHLLNDKEVVLTFDDGPMPSRTRLILKALEAECTTATFFSLGRTAMEYPYILREELALGHTIGTHTWSHRPGMNHMARKRAVDEIERGFSAVTAAAGRPIAPFFRFPYLNAPNAMEKYLQGRKVGIFSIDIDSRDWRRYSPARMVQWIMSRLKTEGKGIILAHDIHTNTARMVPYLLRALKRGGYKVVHVVPKFGYSAPEAYQAVTARFVARLEGTGKAAKGSAGASGEAVSSKPRAATATARSYRKRRKYRRRKRRHRHVRLGTSDFDPFAD